VVFRADFAGALGDCSIQSHSSVNSIRFPVQYVIPLMPRFAVLPDKLRAELSGPGTQ